MPGIVGFVEGGHRDHPERLLGEMARALAHEEWYRVDLYQEREWGLGRVSLGYLNPESQPIWNEDRSLCLVMEGELYDYGELKRELLARGHCFRSNNDAEFLLHMYEEHGEAFADLLNGAFVAAIWDRSARRLVIANDRLGLYPLYYAQIAHRLLFAASAHALLADAELPRAVDPVAIAQFLTFDHMLGERSWLSAVRLLPPASLLIYTADGCLKIRPYWRMKYAERYELRGEDEYVEGFLHVLRKAAARQARDDLPAGMLLSGGLDSRMLLAVLRDGPLSGQFHTFTWGVPGCDDARYAREVSAKVGAHHHFFELKPEYLPQQAEKGVRLTNGGNCVHFHSLAAVTDGARHARVIFKGVIGDAMMGTALNRHFWADYPEETEQRVHFKAHYQRGLLLFTPPEHEDLFTEGFQSRVGAAVMETYWDAMRESRSSQLADQRNYFDLRQRIPRMTLNGVELVRSQAVVRTPYWDNDVVDFTLRLPPGFRFERYITKRALVEAYPDLAKVPYTETGLPLRPCARDLLIRVNRLLAWHLNRWRGRQAPFLTKRPYADYNIWFRTALRPWVEEVLLSERALARGYFKPAAIRKLVAEHMGGANHAVRLGALISLELWHRQFLD